MDLAPQAEIISVNGRTVTDNNRRMMRALVNALVPDTWAILRSLLFQQIDKVPPATINQTLDRVRSIINEH